jgi:hypothetical protein
MKISETQLGRVDGIKFRPPKDVTTARPNGWDNQHIYINITF